VASRTADRGGAAGAPALLAFRSSRRRDFGGTWYWNRYPGIACDCESLIYMPLLEELGYTPSEKYAPGEEIGAHLRRIGDEFGPLRKQSFPNPSQGIRWSAPDERWM